MKLEAENAQLRKELAEKVQVAQAADKVAQEAWQANEDLKKELAALQKEVADSKKAEEQKREEEASAKKALQHLLKTVEALLGKLSNLLIRMLVLVSSYF